MALFKNYFKDNRFFKKTLRNPSESSDLLNKLLFN
jgi:hypothetical protein